MSNNNNNQRVKQMSIHRPIVFGNTAVLLDPPIGSHTHRWTIGVRSAAGPPPSHYTKRGGGDHQQIGGTDPLPWIKKVTFRLHETYSNPVRTVEKPPFEVTETGWGEFDVQIKLFFAPEANEKPIAFYHRLKLHPWPANITDPPNNLSATAEKQQGAVAGGEGGGGDSTRAGGTVQTNGSAQLPADNPSGHTSSSVDSSSSTVAPPVSTSNTTEQNNTVTALTEESSQPVQSTTNDNSVPMETDPPIKSSDPTITSSTQNHDENGGSRTTPAPAEPVITSPVHSWQYDEVVFHEPIESFYNLLIKSPPTPLPKTPRQSLPEPLLPIGQGGVLGELTQQTERAENERLEDATNKALLELESFKSKLMTNDGEIQQLRQELDGTTAT